MNPDENDHVIFRLRVFFWITLVFLLCGCATSQHVATSTLSDSTRTEISARTAAEFADVVLIKPDAASQTNAIAYKFAPLILQEAGRGKPGGWQAGEFGRLVVSNRTVSFDQKLPTIYFSRSHALLRGKLHEQIAYFWFYPPRGPSEPNPNLAAQGVRITLDASGMPAIWEILADTSGAEIIYVSRSLADAARAESGPALPGRQFSIERNLNDAPNTIVARVINDGPVPMGPIIYLCSGTHDVSTVACRCMPTQAKQLVAEGYYGSTAVLKHTTPCAWPGKSLEQRLRLPGRF